MNVKSSQDAFCACFSYGVRRRRSLRRFSRASLRQVALLVSLIFAATLTGCAALDPGNWQVVGPPSSDVRPAPVVVTPAPVIVGPAPAVVQPAAVIVPPSSAVVRPAPVIVGPAPAVVIAPAQPRSSRDAAHFLRERCYLRKGGCYTAESQQRYEFDPYTGTWDWVQQRDYRWKDRRTQ